MGPRTIALIGVAAGGCGRIDFAAVDDGSTGRFHAAITIPQAMVAADLADFPVLVSIDDPSLVAALTGQASFVDPSGAALAYELDPAAQPPLLAWVKLPLLSAETDTVFYVEYGSAFDVGTPNPAQVWSNAFTGVYHFGDGVTLALDDSTGANPADNSGATAGPGMIGGAAAFAGVPGVSAPTVGLDMAAGGLTTATFWLDYTGAFGDGPIAFVNGANAYDLWFQSNGCEGFNTQQSDALGTSMAGLGGRWIYVAAVFYNGVPDPAFNAIYIDGAAQALTVCYAGGSAVARTVGPTVDWGGNPGYEITGAMDEARLANVARSPAWIATEYANQRDPASFAVVGPIGPAP